MNVGELYRLGRRLTEISRKVASEPGDQELPLGETVVLDDVLAHPNSSVGEITERTGLAQSYVSATVARFKSSGALGTTSDPSDGRRTLVRVNERVLRGVFSERGARNVDGAVAEALIDPQAVEQAVVMLEELAQLLLSEAGRGAGGDYS